MIKIVRHVYNTYHVIDEVYKDDKLQFEQSNLNSKNRFGTKEFKANNGKLLNVQAWEWGVKKQ